MQATGIVICHQVSYFNPFLLLLLLLLLLLFRLARFAFAEELAESEEANRDARATCRLYTTQRDDEEEEEVEEDVFA